MEDHNMISAAFLDSKPSIRPETRKIRARWSAQERKERAAEGRRRIQQFLRLLDERSEEAEEPELWAVGALADCDLQRLGR
jgi:hypothetical protein